MSEYNYNYNYGQPSPGPGPGSRPPRKDDDWGAISWVLGLILTVTIGPLGLFLTIAHATGNDLLGYLLQAIFGGRKMQKASDAVHRQTEKARSAAQKARKKAAQREPGGRFTGVRRADRGAVLKTVFGWILVAFGLFATMGTVFDQEGVWAVLSMLCVALGGGAMVFSGLMSRRKEAKFRRCFAVSGDRGVVDMRKLARTLGVKLEEADKLFSEMVDRGYYGEKAYIDHERCLLVIDVEDMRDIYRQEDEANKTRQQSDAEAKMTEYERYVERIRQADVDIDDEVMSEKIRRMQNLTASIFAEVQAHPEKRPMIDRFMTYYLPTTLKLLDSYARIEEQGVSGENMAKAKKDIEGIADTLVAGYEKQLDKLYKAEAMDIAGDVGVIENMLRRDGLTDKNDFGTAMGGH